MKTFFATVTCLAWGLWFGGLISIFIFVPTLFRWNRDMAIQTAPHLFAAFEPYQICLAIIAVLSTIAWKLAARRGLIAILALFVLATIGATISHLFLTSRMQDLLASGNTQSEEFRQLHGESMGIYTLDAACLLGVGLMLPTANRKS